MPAAWAAGLFSQVRLATITLNPCDWPRATLGPESIYTERKNKDRKWECMVKLEKEEDKKIKGSQSWSRTLLWKHEKSQTTPFFCFMNIFIDPLILNNLFTLAFAQRQSQGLDPTPVIDSVIQ